MEDREIDSYRRRARRRFRLAPALSTALLLLAATRPALSAESAVEAESAAAEEDNGAGIVAQYGSVTAFFRFFGDVGARYDSIEVLPTEIIRFRGARRVG